jgi:hypothetical protein
MKKSILIVLFFMLTTSLFAQQEGHNQASKDGNAVFIQDTTLILVESSFDFGKIPQGKPVHHNFEIINSGKQPIKIENVQASCGCTTPEWEKDKDILAGGNTTIKVGYNAATDGQFTKSITITYNTDQTKVLTIKGEVWKTPSASAPSNNGINDLKDR